MSKVGIRVILATSSGIIITLLCIVLFSETSFPLWLPSTLYLNAFAFCEKEGFNKVWLRYFTGLIGALLGIGFYGLLF